MKTKTFKVIGVAVGVFVVAALWWRVRQLERSVDSLTRQLQARPEAVTVGGAKQQHRLNEKDENYFQLIEAVRREGGTTEVGVPWSVEHGMMLDAAEHSDLPPEVSQPNIHIQGSPSLREQLQSPILKQEPPAAPNEGFN
jgi:hypothetical protein